MKKAILAIDDEKRIENINIKEINFENLNIKKIQYREGVLELLKKNTSIDLIILSEKIPGEISIEELIKKIKEINKNIKIIFLYERMDTEKENKLKELKINYLYNIKKISKNNNKKNNYKNKKLSNKNNFFSNKNIKKLNKKGKNKKNKINKLNRIILFLGKINLEKINFIYLVVYYLINKNKKILLININNNFIKKDIIKNDNKLNKFYIINMNYKEKNFKRDIEEIILKYKNLCDYIVVNIGYIKKDRNNNIIKFLMKNIIKIIYITNNTYLGIKEFNKDSKNFKNIFEEKNIVLHIVKIKNYLFSISNLLIKKIIGSNYKIYNFYLKNNYINLQKKIYNNENINFNFKNKKIIEKILE